MKTECPFTNNLLDLEKYIKYGCHRIDTSLPNSKEATGYGINLSKIRKICILQPETEQGFKFGYILFNLDNYQADSSLVAGYGIYPHDGSICTKKEESVLTFSIESIAVFKIPNNKDEARKGSYVYLFRNKNLDESKGRKIFKTETADWEDYL